ncbi:hypothetical protein WJT74_10400 [Sphingomicrobium sp. XHP0239]|uniref:hypothetical protein n=1 Tax=Sphingomicrobium maritimum TaxID=3133972 RepID=UPI0031CCD4D6
MLLASLALAFQPAPVPAADSLQFDLSCISVLSAAAQQDETMAPRLMPVSTFYIGRVDARSVSDADLRTAAQSVGANLANKDVQPVFDACAARFRAAGQRLTALNGAREDAPAVGR